MQGEDGPVGLPGMPGELVSVLQKKKLSLINQNIF